MVSRNCIRGWRDLSTYPRYSIQANATLFIWRERAAFLPPASWRVSSGNFYDSLSITSHTMGPFHNWALDTRISEHTVRPIVSSFRGSLQTLCHRVPCRRLGRGHGKYSAGLCVPPCPTQFISILDVPWPFKHIRYMCWKRSSKDTLYRNKAR